MRSHFLLLLFLCLSSFVQAKGYLVHLTIDKLMLHNDSIRFKTPKSFFLEITDRTDTLEIGKPNGKPVAIVVDIRKRMSAGKVVNEIGYAFFQKENSKWVRINHFGYTNRTAFLNETPEIKKRSPKNQAHENYACSMGLPVWFSAAFRMDVYLI
ncbi:MAG: hypothetical protein ACRCYO_00725 [Bacteroidia bacterium]